MCRRITRLLAAFACKPHEMVLKNVSPPLEKCVGHSLILLVIVKKIGPFRKFFAPWCPKLVTGLLLTPLQLPFVYHNPSCDGCARDAEENRMREKNLVDKT